MISVPLYFHAYIDPGRSALAQPLPIFTQLSVTRE